MKISWKRFSFLSLALVSASAVVAAFVPASKEKAAKAGQDGAVIQVGQTTDTGSCIMVGATDPKNCHMTATAGANGTSSADPSPSDPDPSTTDTEGNTTEGDND